MGFRLKTSKETMEIFDYLSNRMNLQAFALSKLAIALSLKEEESIEDCEAADQKGLELNRQTILGDYDEIFKCLIEQDLNRSLGEDEFYPYYTKKHLDRGALILKNKYDYNKNYEGLFQDLIDGREGI